MSAIRTEPKNVPLDPRSLNPFLDAIFANSLEAIVVADDQGTIRYATRGAELLTGHDAAGMIGSSAFDFLHPDDVEAAAQLFARRLGYDGSDLGHEIRIRHTSGEWVPTMATAALLPESSPGVCAITLRSTAGADVLVERSLRSLIVVGEYANRLSAGLMEATTSAAVLERIQRSSGEIGLLTGAEVVEVLLERRERGTTERLASWMSTAIQPGRASPSPAVIGDSVDLLLAGEIADDDTSRLTEPSLSTFCRRTGAVSLLSTPFAVGDQRGVVVLMRLKPGPSWSSADTELVRSVASLYGRALHTARSEELLALTYREGPIGFSIRTWDGHLVDCNQRYLDLHLLSREDAERQDLPAALGPDQRPVMDAQLALLERGEIDRIQLDVELTRGDGATFWAQTTTVPLRVPGSSERLVLMSVEDITETHTQRIELEHAAHHDPLTGLANRTAMTAAIDRLAAIDGRFPALLIIDLDRFKFVNDSLGHVVGDRVLRSVAEKISDAVRSEDVVARLGGDEFAVVVPGLTLEMSHRLARRLQRAVERPIDVDGRSISQTLSIGIAMGDSSADSSDLLVRADRALYAAKTGGRDNYVVYDESLEFEAGARLTLERELRSALDEGQLEMYFQPEFAIEDGRILGAEALLRWRHPRRGLISADQFVLIAEQTGMIDDIGRFALRDACRRFAAIPGTVTLTLRVNISAREFARPELPALVRAVLAESGVRPDRLCLEMTETTLMGAPDVALRTFARLHSIGVQSAIDDFGTGYSSLAYLKRFPVDVLKIDRTFVDDIVTDPESRAIVSSIMGLSEALSLEAVAEGVETVEQLDALRSLGCGRAQGYLLAPALPEAEFARLLVANAAGAGLCRPWVARRALPPAAADQRPPIRPASCT